MYISRIILMETEGKKRKQIKQQHNEQSIINKAKNGLFTIIDGFVKSSHHQVNNIGLPTIENTYSNEILRMKKVPNSTFEKNKEKIVKEAEEKLKIEGSTSSVVGNLLQGYMEKTANMEKKQVIINKEKKRITKEIQVIEEEEKKQYINFQTFLLGSVGKMAAKIATSYGVAIGPVLFFCEVLAVVPAPIKNSVVNVINPAKIYSKTKSVVYNSLN